MANQYSNYTLAPYVSQYVNPYSVEVNQVLRERYDANKSNKDKIDATLGAWNTLPGDAHLVDKAKEQTRGKLNQFIENGNYEDASMAVSETMVDLESDKGLKLAKQSYDVRAQELAWMSEMTVKQGKNFLDFGRGAVNTWSSYYKGEDGEFIENVYKPTNEPEHDYDQAMGQLIGNIRADYTGISRGKADAIAESLIPTYLNGTEGDQDYRQLTIINGMSHNEAISDIRNRLQSLTDQQIHRTKAASIKSSASKMNGDGSINVGYTAQSSEGTLNLADHYNKVLDGNARVFENFDNPDVRKGHQSKMAKDTKRMTMQQARASLSPEEYVGWKRHNIDLYKGHEEFGALVNYSTTSTWQPTNATQEDLEWDEMATSAIATGATVATAGAVATYFGLANAWNPIGWVTLASVGVGALVNYAYQADEKELLSEKGNVRDMMNAQQGDGALWGLLDSESEELASNLEDTEWVNEILGTNYKNGDPVYEQLKKNAQSTLLYRQQGGGDEHDDTVNSYNGDVFEAETFVVDYNNTKLVNAIDNIEKQFDPTNWDFLGIAEGDSGWESMMTDKNGDKVLPGDAKIEFRGVTAPSIDDDVPLMFKWNINGRTYLAESKYNKPSSFDLEELIAMDMNQAELVVIDRARQWVNDVENKGTGATRDGNPSKQELVEVLNTLYKNIVGMGDEDAANYAEQYMFQSFQQSNPTLLNQITQQMYGGIAYNDLSPNEKSAVDGKLNEYYTTYKTSEVR